MKYYRTCPICKAHLDPGERCDCELKQVVKRTSNPKAFVFTEQYRIMKQQLIASLNCGR